MDETDRYRALRDQGQSREEALAQLRRAGASPMMCIRAIREAEGTGIAEAKRLFLESSSWADVVKATDDAFIGEHLSSANLLERTTTIYVALLDEDVEVWKPVTAVHVEGDIYRIVSANAGHADEMWEFDRGDVVRCTDQQLSGTDEKVAISLVPPAGNTVCSRRPRMR